MFERFTDRARRVVVLAQEEARLLNHNWIGTEHLLLGMISEGEGVAAKVLTKLGISLEAVRAKVESIIGEGGKEPPSGHIPFTPRSKKVLELSLREALQLGHNYIGTEHILLGLIREGEGLAAQVLVNMGADLSTVRQSVMQELSGYSRRGGAGGPFPPVPETPAMARSRVDARRLAGSRAVGSHHQLLALLDIKDSLAAKALAEFGVTREAVEDQLSRLDPAGTSDETPEEAGARRIGLRVEGKLIALEIDDPELAEALEKAMTGRKVRVIRGTDPEAEAAGFPNLWSAVSRTVDDLTHRLGRMTSARSSGSRKAESPPGWDPEALAAGYVLANTKDGPAGHFEAGSGIDATAAKAWLRSWLIENRAQLVGPEVEDPTRFSAMWALLSRAGEPFGMQNVGYETEGGEPVPLDILIGYAIDDLAA
jgi:ATP-dependent Clp protease ATP-binding subunit ClpA